jgi:hypothetical protein
MRLSRELAIEKRELVRRLLDRFVSGELVALWLSGAGEPWQTYHEFTFLISDECDPELWDFVLSEAQRNSFVLFRERLSVFDTDVTEFTSDVAQRQDFKELQRLAKTVLEGLEARQ